MNPPAVQRCIVDIADVELQPRPPFRDTGRIEDARDHRQGE